MSHDQLLVKVIAGSTRDGRFSDQAAKWIADIANARADMEAEVLDLREYDMPFFNESVSPSVKKEPYTNEAVARFTTKIAEGGAYIIVTPEYNHGTSAVLKNALDWVYQEWNNKPVGFVSYGNAGGARAIEQLRLVAVELQMAPIREAVHIHGDKFFPVHFGDADANEMFASLGEKADGMLEQLSWWGKALQIARTT